MESYRKYLVVITTNNSDTIKSWEYATTRAHAIDRAVFAYSYDYPGATYCSGNIVRETKQPNAQEIINKF